MGRGYVFHTVVSVRALKNICKGAVYLPLCSIYSDSAFRNFNSINSMRSQNFSIFKKPVEPQPHVYIKLTCDSSSGYPYVISGDQEKVITGNNPEAKIKLQELLLYLYLKREQGDKLPDKISMKDFVELLFLKEDEIDYMLEIIYYHLEMKKQAEEQKVSINKTIEKESIDRQERLNTQDHPYLHYGFGENSLFRPILKIYQSRYYNYILGQGLIYGQKVVFDCSFDNYMNIMQIRETAKDLNECVSQNRRSVRPFSLSFCNVKDNSRVMQYLKKINPAVGFDLPVNLHSCSYLDLFRREDIVYLSSHVNREVEYHPDDIYVIGALSNTEEPLSLKKARRDGVRCAKLPIGFNQLIRRSFTLKIHEVFETLTSKKNTGEWSHARKIRGIVRMPNS